MKVKTIESPEHIKLLKWLSVALSTDKNRIMLNCLHISEGGEAVATDGKRMHIVKDGIKADPGNYRLSLSKNEAVLSEEEGVFPDWLAIIPNSAEHFAFDLRNRDSATHLSAGSGVPINYTHLTDALGYGSLLTKNKGCKGRFHYRDSISPVKVSLCDGTLLAVIMPLAPM